MDEKRVDQILVCKIDRLTRSLLMSSPMVSQRMI